MTPGARVSAVIEILDEYLLGKPENKLLLNWFRRNRFAGVKDRLAIRDLFFKCLRYKLSCQWPFEQAGFSITGRSIVLGMLKSSGKCFDQIFDGMQYSPKTLSKSEKVVIDSFNETISSAPTFVRLNFPEFLDSSFKDSFDKGFWDNLTSLSTQANLFVRINCIKSNLGAAINSLKDDGIEVEVIPNFKNSLKIIENSRKLRRSEAYLSGKVEIQDISSQAVVNFIEPKKNIKILDFCAGAGGKTLAMASLTLGASEYFVHDTDRSKLNNLNLRCKRAGVHVKHLNLKNTKKKNSNFDLVVADVPCSGTGVWKRNPGSKWLITEDKLIAILADQKKILREASELVKKGGTLAYITCSVLKSENQEQIAWFLSQDLTFSFLEDSALLPINGGDGFYVALLIKNF